MLDVDDEGNSATWGPHVSDEEYGAAPAGHSDETMRSLLTLSGVRPGDVVAVVGDGGVGLCAVIAARRLGAGRVNALSRNPARQELARSFGATDILAQRGDAARVTVLELANGVGVDTALRMRRCRPVDGDGVRDRTAGLHRWRCRSPSRRRGCRSKP
jgi:D-arabinose 1-dehydrogenase-like Zn-dependent alcohol dehydrogenase